MTHRIHFDPLYGAVAFRAERLGLDDFWGSADPLGEQKTAGVLAEHLDSILDSYEMNRLHSLKQAGFSWLIYPSATHTRYAHSLGCWYLGEQALDSVQIVTDQPGTRSHRTQRRFLIDWLRSSNLQEEFMLALLLHDIGHFPFSHVLERNPMYAGVSHEQMAVQLILGRGELASLVREKAERSLIPAAEGGLGFLAEALRGMSTSVVDADSVCALITGDETYVSGKPEEVKTKIRLLKELVSGVVDLDRIDHYHRDAFFMGLRIGYVNPIALLAGMELCLSADRQHCWIRLDDTSIMQAIALLSTRDMLTKNVFDYEENVAYEVMLNAAVNVILNRRPELRLRFLAWTDYELLTYLLENDTAPTASRLAARILARQPYQRIGRYQVVNPDYESVEGLNQVAQWIRDSLIATGGAGAALASHDILVRYSPRILNAIPCEGKHSPASLGAQWFDLDKLQTTDGRTLAKHDMYERQIKFLAEQEAEQASIVQFFASSRQLASHARTVVERHGALRPVD